MVSKAIAAAGINAAIEPNSRPDMFSRHHRPPVRQGRLNAETEEAQRTDEQNGEGEPQAELGRQRPDGVGEDLASDDPPQVLAAGSGDVDEVHGGHVHAEGTRQAEHRRRLDQADRDNQHRDRRSQRSDDDQGEQDRGERHRRVVDAAQHVVHPPSRRGRREAQGDANGKTPAGRPPGPARSSSGRRTASARKIAPQVVAAEPANLAGCGKTLVRDNRVLRQRRQQGPEDGQKT